MNAMTQTTLRPEGPFLADADRNEQLMILQLYAQLDERGKQLATLYLQSLLTLKAK